MHTTLFAWRAFYDYFPVEFALTIVASTHPSVIGEMMAPVKRQFIVLARLAHLLCYPFLYKKFLGSLEFVACCGSGPREAFLSPFVNVRPAA